MVKLWPKYVEPCHSASQLCQMTAICTVAFIATQLTVYNLCTFMETCDIISFSHFAELKHLHASLCEVSGYVSLQVAVEMKRTSALKLPFVIV